MYLIVTSILVLYSGLLVMAQDEYWMGPPTVMKWRSWTYHALNKHLTNMTYELIKDSNTKVAVTHTLRGPYEGQLSMQLGLICANIQEHYTKLLVIYRKFADLQVFRQQTQDIEEHLDYFHIAQNIYHKIRLEERIFYKMVAKREIETRAIKKLQKKIALGSASRRQMDGKYLASSQMVNSKTQRNLQENNTKAVPSDPFKKTEIPKFVPESKLNIEPSDLNTGPIDLNIKPDSMEIADMKMKLKDKTYDMGMKIDLGIKNDEAIKKELKFKAENFIQRIEDVIKNTYRNKMIPDVLVNKLSDLNKEFDAKNLQLYNFKRDTKVNFVAEKKAALDRFKYMYDEELPPIDPSKHPLKNGRRNEHGFKGLPVEVTSPSTKKRKWQRARA